MSDASPVKVAIVGASDRENSIGAHTLSNLVDHSDFKGELLLVNPKQTEIRGIPCHPSVEALPATPDVAVIVIPAPGVVEAVRQAGARGIDIVYGDVLAQNKPMLALSRDLGFKVRRSLDDPGSVRVEIPVPDYTRRIA